MSEVTGDGGLPPRALPDDSTHRAPEGLATSAVLTRIPQVSPEQWQRLSLPMRWLVATRAAVLVMTFSSAAFGGLLALHGHLVAGTPFDGVAWLACCLGLLLAHATNNLLNDYTDTRKGVDDGNYFRTHYGTHVLAHGLLDEAGLRRYILATGLAALAVGIGLVLHVGTAVLPPLLAGAFFLLAYTWPLKRLGLGEIAVLIVWGPLMVCGTMVTVGAPVDGWTLAASLLFATGPTLVIFGKHIDKLEFDARKAVATLPVRLGEARARRWVIAMTLAQYPVAIGLVMASALPWSVLLLFVSLPGALRLVKMYQAPRPAECPDDWPQEAWPLWFVAAAFQHARESALLLLAGLLISVGVAAAF